MRLFFTKKNQFTKCSDSLQFYKCKLTIKSVWTAARNAEYFSIYLCHVFFALFGLNFERKRKITTFLLFRALLLPLWRSQTTTTTRKLIIFTIFSFTFTLREKKFKFKFWVEKLFLNLDVCQRRNGKDMKGKPKAGEKINGNVFLRRERKRKRNLLKCKSIFERSDINKIKKGF